MSQGGLSPYKIDKEVGRGGKLLQCSSKLFVEKILAMRYAVLESNELRTFEISLPLVFVFIRK